VMWQVHVGDSAVQAYENSAAETGAFDINGWNYPCVVRRSGNAAYIKLSSVANKRWVLEEVVLETMAAGKRRVWAQEAS